jgi:acetylglutamate kinase
MEKRGVLSNVNDENAVIRLMNEMLYQELLREGVLTDGILPKLENAFAALRAGVKEILIGKAGDLIRNTHEETEGTLIKLK